MKLSPEQLAASLIDCTALRAAFFEFVDGLPAETRDTTQACAAAGIAMAVMHRAENPANAFRALLTTGLSFGRDRVELVSPA